MLHKLNKIVYVENYESDYVYAHPSLIDDLDEILSESGKETDFGKQFRKKIIFLENLKKNCIQQKSFERLSKHGYLYSLRVMDVHNIRILFAFFALQGKEIVILLYAFPEKSKSTKNNPKSYSYAIEKAEERIEELKSVYEDLQLITN
ncbi:type II toxin-antitoxin system RelE/ParE family toxin [Anaerocellum diazotrophicum]|uniref:Uncharacterized protein n=1 Tax=Caldicellulosiruptor diazotrophicus TaxID=2806205 RepID=A0ABM7NJH0_9FIRM|nr:hypothetical protein [Caldicellulosiruptor diazotrophicus]BCS80249.1 hypothetical protein CaldiYA01_02090 [Caldicellulosiruptor diazotrophicus]